MVSRAVNQPRWIALKYAFFALIATVLNLGGQWLTLVLYDGPFAIYFAMAVGTGAGLVSKYLLDKYFIFEYKPKNTRDDFRTFLLYSGTGVFTTLLFWGTELAFHFTWQDPSAKYVGAVLGLTIGYVTKYYLDKHVVFRERP